MAIHIIHGDCRDILPTLPADSFDCCVTSPPYFGLRDYGVARQIGLEPTMQDYLETMVEVCRGVRRVLKPDGCFFLNIGDCYAGPSKTGSRERTGLKPKDLCMVPNRLAIMLQDDGWYVRSEIIWHKPNPMPESVTDRPTSAHEKVWLLTKSERYAYDAEAIAEEAEGTAFARKVRENASGKDYSRGRGHGDRNDSGMSLIHATGETRNARNVWTIASQPYSGAHFATMPPALADRCIKAGCPVGGTVLDPFGGAGTTALVADRLGRHATLIELNPVYQAIGQNRLCDDAPLFVEII